MMEAIISLEPHFAHWAKEGSSQFRSRFLKLVILLLFLVSDIHLGEISSLLKSAYNLKANRRPPPQGRSDDLEYSKTSSAGYILYIGRISSDRLDGP
jgi:hypothetical protein